MGFRVCGLVHQTGYVSDRNRMILRRTLSRAASVVGLVALSVLPVSCGPGNRKQERGDRVETKLPRDAAGVLKRIRATLEGARSLRVRARYEGDQGVPGEGTLLLKEGNRARKSGKFTGPAASMSLLTISDGTRQWSHFSLGKPWERPTPDNLNKYLIDMLLGPGLLTSILLDYNLRAPAEGYRYPIEDIRFGERGYALSTLRFKVRLPNQRAYLEVRLLYRPDTYALVKRSVEQIGGRRKRYSTETYEEFSIDADIPDKAFALPVTGPFVERILAVLPPDIAGFREVEFSRDGKVAAISVKSGATGKAFIMRNGKRGEAFDQVAEPILSRDGSVLAFIAFSGKRSFVVSNGKKHRPFDKVTRPFLSPDGKVVAYRAHLGNDEVMVINGVEGKRFDDVHVPSFNPKDNTVAYAADRGGKGFIIVGEKASAPYDGAWWPAWSPDGETLAFGAEAKGKQFMVVGGKKGKAYDIVGQLRFSPEGKTFAYEARKDGKMFVVAGEKEGNRYDGVWHPSFSPDGEILAFAARKKMKMFMIVGDHEFGPYDELMPGTFVRDGTWATEPVWSADGRKFAFRARRSKGWFAVVGDLESGKVKLEKAFPAVGRPVLSPDGTTVAYTIATATGSSLVFTGKFTSSFERIGPILFSSDGRKIAFGIKGGEFVSWKVVDVK